MIRRAEPGQQADVRAVLERWGGCIGLRMAGALDTFGLEDDTCAFYWAGDSVLCLDGAQALLCGVPEDVAELENFLHWAGAASFFSGQVLLDTWRPLPRLVMRRPAELHRAGIPLPTGAELCGTPALWDLAQSGLLTDRADGLYAALCRRVNRGTGRVWSVQAGKVPVAAAAVTAIQVQGVYLGALATRQDWRRKECAAALVHAVAEQWPERPVWIICEPGLRMFYERLGFGLNTPMCEFVPVAEN